jgi:hypothetical protein
MVVQAHRLMHDDGGVGQVEHVMLHMDSVTRELLSETGSYPDAAPSTSAGRHVGAGPRPRAAGTGRHS